jgi:hypothetical protein
MAISQILYPGPPPLVIDANSLASWTILRSRFLVPSSRLALRMRNRKCVATTANKPRQRRHGLRRCYERASLLPSCSSWYSSPTSAGASCTSRGLWLRQPMAASSRFPNSVASTTATNAARHNTQQHALFAIRAEFQWLPTCSTHVPCSASVASAPLGRPPALPSLPSNARCDDGVAEARWFSPGMP